MSETAGIKRTRHLDELSAADSRMSKMNLLRNAFDKVASLIEKDVPLIVIVESLNNDGLKISLGHFKSAFSKIRKERGFSRVGRSREVQNDRSNSASLQLALGNNSSELRHRESTQNSDIDIFAIRAEREAVKNVVQKLQKLPRR